MAYPATPGGGSATQPVHPQRQLHVETAARVAPVGTQQLGDPVQPLHHRVGVDVQALGRSPGPGRRWRTTPRGSPAGWSPAGRRSRGPGPAWTRRTPRARRGRSRPSSSRVTPRPAGSLTSPGPAEGHQRVQAPARLGVRRGQRRRSAQATPTVASPPGGPHRLAQRLAHLERVAARDQDHHGAVVLTAEAAAGRSPTRDAARTAAWRSSRSTAATHTVSGGSSTTRCRRARSRSSEVGVRPLEQVGEQLAAQPLLGLGDGAGEEQHQRGDQGAALERAALGEGERPGAAVQHQGGDVFGAGERRRHVGATRPRPSGPRRTASATRSCQPSVRRRRRPSARRSRRGSPAGRRGPRRAPGRPPRPRPPCSSRSVSRSWACAALSTAARVLGHGAVGLVELGEEPRVLERHRRVGRERRQQADLARTGRAARVRCTASRAPMTRPSSISGTPRMARICSPATASSMNRRCRKRSSDW